MRIVRGLHNARVTGWASLVTLVYFAAEWVVSATWRGHYGYREDLIGPLGTAFCGPAGNWPCSDLYRVMNVGLVLTGLAIVFVAASMLAQRVAERGPVILLLSAGIGLALSGIITQQVDYSWNLTAIVAFMTLGSVSVLFIAVGSTSALSAERRGLAVAAGVVSLVGYLTFMGGHTIFGSGGAQRMAIYGILVAVIALCTSGLRVTPADSVDARQLVEDLR